MTAVAALGAVVAEQNIFIATENPVVAAQARPRFAQIWFRQRLAVDPERIGFERQALAGQSDDALDRIDFAHSCMSEDHELAAPRPPEGECDPVDQDVIAGPQRGEHAPIVDPEAAANAAVKGDQEGYDQGRGEYESAQRNAARPSNQIRAAPAEAVEDAWAAQDAHLIARLIRFEQS